MTFMKSCKVEGHKSDLHTHGILSSPSLKDISLATGLPLFSVKQSSLTGGKREAPFKGGGV